MKQILFISLLIATTNFGYSQKTTLAFQLDKGTTYYHDMVVKSTVQQNYDGEPFDMKMTVSGAISYKVKSINAQDFDLDVRYESMNMRIEAMQNVINFSSNKQDESDIFSTILSKMIGKPFLIKMSKKGKVLEVKNSNKIINSLIDELVDVPEDAKNEMRTQLIKAYGEEAFKGSFEMVTAIFPDHPVAIGDTWNIVTNLETNMAAKMNTVYELKELHSNYAILKGKATIKTEDKDAYIKNDGITMKYDLTGEMLSTIKLDRKSGWVIDATTTQDIGGNAYLKDYPNPNENYEIPIQINTTITYTNNIE